MRYAGQWKDLGTWNTLTEAMSEDSVGETIMNDSCTNVHIINELDIPVLAMGLQNIVISAGPDGILVSDKEQSSYIKSFVDKLNQQIMYAEKSWGSYRVLDVGRESLTIKVILRPGQRMNYHRHKYRDEKWTVIAGTGDVIVDGKSLAIHAGDSIEMPAGCCHTVIARTELEIIEVQLGNSITVQDKEKCQLQGI